MIHLNIRDLAHHIENKVTIACDDLTSYQKLYTLPNTARNKQSLLVQTKEGFQIPPLFQLEAFIFLKIAQIKNNPGPIKQSKKAKPHRSQFSDWVLRFSKASN